MVLVVVVGEMVVGEMVGCSQGLRILVSLCHKARGKGTAKRAHHSAVREGDATSSLRLVQSVRTLVKGRRAWGVIVVYGCCSYVENFCSSNSSTTPASGRGQRGGGGALTRERPRFEPWRHRGEEEEVPQMPPCWVGDGSDTSPVATASMGVSY